MKKITTLKEALVSIPGRVNGKYGLIVNANGVGTFRPVLVRVHEPSLEWGIEGDLEYLVWLSDIDLGNSQGLAENRAARMAHEHGILSPMEAEELAGI